MSEAMQPAASGLVCVWAKGFRVSIESQEFQRVVPPVFSGGQQATALEDRIDGFSGWGGLLDPFYQLDQAEIDAERCLLVSESEIQALRVRRTADRHKRPSVVVVTVTASVSWDAVDVGRTAGCCDGLALRLARAYADTFKGNPAEVETQLRDGTFLQDREFALGAEEVGGRGDWTEVVEAIREWQGIQGVATKRLVPLGANVLLGTRYEADSSSLRSFLDGHFDVREKRIMPLSKRLQPWVRGSSLGARRVDQERPPETGFEPEVPPAEVSLRNIHYSLDRMADLLDAWFRSWLGGPPREDRRRGKKKRKRDD